jgi:hypothetical protein
MALLQAFGALWEPAVNRLLKPMILTGLSEHLTKALQRVMRKLPATVPIIQQHILVPVLASLPVPWIDVEAERSAANALTPLSSNQPASGGTLLRQREVNGAHSSVRSMALTTFRIKPELLQPSLVEFSKQVQAQVRFASCSKT